MEQIIKNLIKEYKQWAKELKEDIDTYNDEFSASQKFELNAVETAIEDLTKLKNEIDEFLNTPIRSLIKNGFDNHEQLGFDLAKEFFKNKNQNFDEVKKNLYKEQR